MGKRSVLLLFLIVGFGLWYAGRYVYCLSGACAELQSWNQKLTLVIDTPSGEVTAMSVVQIVSTYYGGHETIGANEVSYFERGETAMVEVTPGRWLFAIVGTDAQRFYAAAQDRFIGMPRSEWLRQIPQQEGAVTLLPNLMPELVTFDDVNEPATIRKVDPADLVAVFGDGVSLKSATLEITEEPITHGKVEKLLNWLGPYPETPLIDGASPTDYSLAAITRQGDFIRR
jgi:hypothetical protein